MDPTAVEFGAIRRVDVAAPVYAMDFDIRVPFLLQSGSRIKDHYVAMPVDEHRASG